MAEPEQKIIREGDPEGSPSVHFDREKRLPYHHDRHGGRVYHAAPASHAYGDDGALLELPEPMELDEISGTVIAVSAANPAVPPLQGEPLKVPAGTVLPKLEPLPTGAAAELGIAIGKAPVSPAPSAPADGSPVTVKEGDSHV